MKKRKILKELFRRFFGKHRKDAVGAYLDRFETIEKLIADDRIAIDIVKCYVALDASVHRLYMNDDRKYLAFFDTLRAYINYSRGYQGIKTLLQPEDRIDFGVMYKLYKAFDLEKGEFYPRPKAEFKTLLVGYVQDGQIEYTVWKEVKAEST